MKYNNEIEKDIKKNEHKSVIRVHWDETEDIGIVTHYKGKPFTGVAFDLHENGNVFEEAQMLEGLKHGKHVIYSKDSSVQRVSFYENDLRISHDENTFDKETNKIFPDDKYEDVHLVLHAIDTQICVLKKIDETRREIKQLSQTYYHAYKKGIVDSMIRLNKFSEKAIINLNLDDD